MTFNRRQIMAGVTAAAFAPRSAWAQDDAPFHSSFVRDLARDIARRPFQRVDTALPRGLADIDYDYYRGIVPRPERAFWRGEGLKFEMQMFHRGFLFDERVSVHVVSEGRARRLRYSPTLFLSDKADIDGLSDDLDFSGFRLHTALNRPNEFDEFMVFQGASYFRSIGREQTYGLSARGFAMDTGLGRPEEFPLFKSFWVEKPAPGDVSVTAHALMDSRSLSGAFRFAIRPGDWTVMDVDASLFARADIAEPGLAPLTSMYYFSPVDRKFDDWRPAVHDSDGLEIWNGRDERLWRAIANPRRIEISSFVDDDPRGFGLMQRRRHFRDYQDLYARYQTRPSLWVETIGDWGRGHVRLIELPTDSEFADNIIAYWVPEEPLRAGQEKRYSYRLHWGQDSPAQGPLARFTDTMSGPGGFLPRSRFFSLNAEGGALKQFGPKEELGFLITARGADVVLPGEEHNPWTGGRRLAFRIAADSYESVEIRAQLTVKDRPDQPLSEVWLHRWTAPRA